MSDKPHDKDPQDKDPRDPERRDFLITATGAVAGAGMVTTAWPFINSMNPSRDVLAKSTTEVSLNGIEPGQSTTVEWQGKPVFILHRTDQQISKMNESQGVKDPEADAQRIIKPEWLVVVGLCTHLGCVPSRKKDGWFCPCHGSVYDNSGRILRGPAPKNLEKPPYEFLTDNKIVIGKTSKG